MNYEWSTEKPKYDGDYFYNGPLPDGTENVIAIVQVFTDPVIAHKMACLFIPPGWRGTSTRTQPTGEG